MSISVSDSTLQMMLRKIGSPSPELAVSWRTDELHSILSELLHLRSIGTGDRALVDALLAGEPFVFDPATNFVHADDGGAPEHGIRYEPSARPDAEGEVDSAMSDEHSINEKRLEELVNETDLNSRRPPPHIIFTGWWLEVHLALVELQTCRAALSAMRKHAALLEKELSSSVDRENALSAATKVRAIREGDGEAILAASKWHDHHTGTDTTIGSLNALRNTREIIAAYLAASPIPTTGGEKE